jgi:hypothetical protein
MCPSLSSALRHVEQGPRLVEVLGDGLRAAAATAGPAAVPLLRRAIGGTDELTAIAAVHAPARWTTTPPGPCWPSC